MAQCIPEEIQHITDNDYQRVIQENPGVTLCGKGVCAPGGSAAVPLGSSPGLSADCDLLLQARHVLDPTNAKGLNWSGETGIDQWNGVTVTAGRVSKINFNNQGANGSVPAASRMTGIIPPQLSQLTELKELMLAKHSLTGAIPPQLGLLAKLEKLNLNHNDLTGAIPAELGSLARLTELRLAHSELSGNIPTGNGDMTGIVIVALRGNSLTGAIPAGFAGLQQIREVTLANNRLTGGVPPFTSPSLKIIDLAGNDLTGEIPTSLAGGIPSQLGNLAKLAYLGIADNDLDGPLPAALADLRLTRFDADRNSFTCAPARLKAKRFAGLRDLARLPACAE